MKKRTILLLCAVVLAAVCVGLLAFGNVCIGRIENRADGDWSQLHIYMNGEHTIPFPVSEPGQACVFQWESGRGSFAAEITDADGAVLFTTESETKGNGVFEATSDLTLHIDAMGHGGVFSLTLRDPELLSEDPDAEPEPHLLLDGHHSGDTYTATYQCRKFDGKYLNFYVENYGDTPVIITINGENDRTIPAGSSGHITANVSATVVDQEMTVKCKSKDGGEIDIYWKVAQRSS